MIPDLQRKSGLVYLSSNYPSVTINSVDITNDIRAVGEGQKEETTIVTVNTNISEAILDELVNDNEFVRFYNTPNYISNLRVRIVACFGTQGQSLDYITQRMNEYQAGLMTISGQADADEFYIKLINNLTSTEFSLLSSAGPFGSDTILNTLKTNLQDKIYYSPSSDNDGIILCDLPLDDVLQKDKDGNVLTNKKTRSLIKNTTAEGSENFANYVVQTIDLKPFVFRIGSAERYTNSELSDVRFYAFTYMDNQAFLESQGLSKDSTIGEEDRLIETGMGFVKSAVFRGVEYDYLTQEQSSVITNPEIESETLSPMASKMSDRRGYQRLNLVDFKNQIILNTTGLLKELDVNNKTYQSIETSNFFSDFWVTKCEDDNARFGFVFDKLAYLSKNSEFPFLYSNPNTAKDLMTGGGDLQLTEDEIVKCLDITMSKRQIREDSTIAVNKLTFGKQKKFDESYYRPEEIVDKPILIDSLGQFLNPGISRRMSFYEGYDTYADEFKTQTAGTFQYAAEVNVYDPSLNYLRKISDRLREISHRTVNLYELIVNSPPSELERKLDLVADGVGLYDPIKNERIVALSSIAYNNQTAKQSLMSDIRGYVRLFTKMSLTNTLSSNAVETMLMAMVEKKDPYGIMEFNDVVNSFKRGIDQIIETKMPKDPNLESTTALQKLAANTTPTKINILNFKHYFDDLFEYGKRYGTGYLYLSQEVQGNIPNPAGLPTFSRDFFTDRRREEFNKYFGSYNQPGAPSSFANPDGTPYEISSYQYFTPKGIKSFGKEMIVQTSYRAQDENILSYDIDRYADLFNDLVRSRIYSYDYSLPFYSAQDFDVTPRDLFDSANSSLFAHGCVVSEGIQEQFTIPTVGENISKVIKIGKDGNENPEVDAPRIVGTFLGGDSDTDIEAKDFLRTTEKELTPFATGTYGAVFDPSAIDKDEIPLVPAGLPPTKLTFAILGELELDSKVDSTPYLKETFNSMVRNVNKLGLDDISIQSAIENKYAPIPNQLKSMFVIATSQRAKSLGGAGFDAVRPQLEDADTADFVDSISYIDQNEEFPPYNSTRDPMKTYAKFLTFWMNYKQIAVIEYLSGFENLDSIPFGIRVTEDDPTFSRKALRPVWQKFTPGLFNSTSRQTLLCRVRNISKNDLVVVSDDESRTRSDLNKGVDIDFREIFDLPIYNRYFILRGQ